MLIECQMIRAGGSRVEIDGTEYHFKPTATDTRHIANVASKSHIQRFLSIPGYVLAEDDAPEPSLTDEEKAAIEAKTRAAAEAAAEAIRADAEKKAAEEAAGQDKLEAKDLTTMSRDQLVAEYERVTGKLPHPASKTETLIANIQKATSGA